MSGSQTTTSIAIKKLVEPEIVLPVGIKVQLLVAIVDCSPSLIISYKQVLQSVLKLFRDMTKMHVITRASRTLNLQTLTVEHVETQERFDKQKVDGKPDWAPPVGIATEETGIGIARYIADSKILAIHFHAVWMFVVIL